MMHFNERISVLLVFFTPIIDGALEKTRTSTSIQKLAPEASASTNSATRAHRPVSARIRLSGRKRQHEKRALYASGSGY